MDTSPWRWSLLDLPPELVFAVVGHIIEPAALSSLLQTSRQLIPFVAPELYRKLTFYDMDTAGEDAEPRIMSHLLHIRRITPWKEHVREVQVSGSGSPREPHPIAQMAQLWDRWRRFAKIMNHIPMHQLKVFMLFPHCGCHYHVDTVLRTAIQRHHRSLQTVLWAINHDPTDILNDLRALTPDGGQDDVLSGLASLHLTIDTREAALPTAEGLRQFRLTSLSINTAGVDNLSEMPPYVHWVSLLSFQTSLHRLELQSVEFGLHMFCRTLAAMTSLEVLVLCDCYADWDHPDEDEEGGDYDYFLRMREDWRRLLSEQPAKSVKSLTLFDCRPDLIHVILSALPELQNLRLTPQRFPVGLKELAVLKPTLRSLVLREWIPTNEPTAFMQLINLRDLFRDSGGITTWTSLKTVILVGVDCTVKVRAMEEGSMDFTLPQWLLSLSREGRIV